MYKRLLSIFLALCLSFSCFCVPAFAVPVSTEIDMVNDFSRFISDLSDDYRSYKNGDISLDDFFTSTMIHATTELAPNICADITSIKDILRVMEFCGIDVSDAWESFYYTQHMGGDGSGGNRDDSVLNGYGAVCLHYLNGELFKSVYGAYGVIYSITRTNQIVVYADSDTTGFRDLVSGNDTFFSDSSVVGYLDDGSSNSYVFYGDWRYEDESVADDVLSEFPEKEIPNYDDDNLTNDDLIDFFEDLLNELLMQFPDLSTVEGLLRAILAKCTSIDEKMNESGGGMDPAELSLLLDKSILSLTIQNKVNNDALLQELISIREILQGYGDDEIPPDEANSILEGLISGITSGLLSFVGIDLDVSEIIEICEDAGDLGISVLRGIVNIISILNSAVPLQAVNALITTLTGIIFNLNKPTDLTFTLNGAEVTFLSVDLLSVPQIAAALNIIKGLVSIMVSYSWLKWARKFYLSQF